MWNRHSRKLIFILLVPAAIFFIAANFSFKPKKIAQLPNVILIIADDLGYSDLSSYGNPHIHTPNIDGLGINGVRFSQAYVTAAICGPSRVGILTGRYQQRFGSEFMPYDLIDPAVMRNLRKRYAGIKRKNPGLREVKPNFFINRRNFNDGLPSTEITIAEMLRQRGYSTGLVGKWNLGVGEGYHPDQRGYDYSYYFEGALTRYINDPVDSSKYINQHLPWAISELVAWSPRYGSTAIREGRQIVEDTGYLTFSFANRAVNFIEQHKNNPFFLTLTFNAPHDPFQVPREYFNRISGVTDSVKRVYYGMIEALDDGVGMVLQKLKNLQLDQNTIIIFLSDNGGATYTRATDNKPLSGGKCTNFEGGLLVPFFIKYPGSANMNKVYHEPVSSLDIFTTIAAATQTNLPAGRMYDGVNLLPFIEGKVDTIPHNIFYWRSGYAKAIRKGNWKLYINQKDKKTFLFNLAEDREELHDRSTGNAAIIMELQNLLKEWEKTQFIQPKWPSGADVLVNVNGQKFYFPT